MDISTLMPVVNFPVGERGFIPKLAALTLLAPGGRWGVRCDERSTWPTSSGRPWGRPFCQRRTGRRTTS